MCESDPPLDVPKCVEKCLNNVLIYEEREEEVEEEIRPEDIQVGLEALIDKYGVQKVLDTVSRMTASKRG